MTTKSDNKGDRNLPWVEKYRPSSLEDVVAHEEILSTLRRLMDGENMPHLLFYGPPGTGKTTTIKACSYYLYGKDRVRANVLEMNASDDRGIDVVRQQIREFASTSSIFSMFASTPAVKRDKATTERATNVIAAVENSNNDNISDHNNSSSNVGDDKNNGSIGNRIEVAVKAEENENGKDKNNVYNNNINENKTVPVMRSGKPCGYKLVILDEADQMSHDAQAALRRIIEKYTNNVRFCILCNHINKIIPALQSRCTRFRFAPVKKTAMLPRLAFVASSEHVPFDQAGLAAAYRLSQGDLRRCLNTMQSAALSMHVISEESVYKVTGNPTPAMVTSLVSNMLNNDFPTCWEQIYDTVVDNGIAVTDLVREVHPVMMAMELPQECKCFLLNKLADIEYYAAGGATEKIGLCGILGVFQLVKEAVTQGTSVNGLANTKNQVK